MRRLYSFLFAIVIVSLYTFQAFGGNSGDLPSHIKTLKHQLISAKGKERVKILSKLSEELLGISAENSLARAREASDLVRELNDVKLEATVLEQLGRAQCAVGNYKTALQTFTRLLTLQEERKDRKGMAYAMNRIGFTLTDLSRYNEALLNYENALELAKEIHDERTIASTLNEMGVTYWYKGDVDSALPKFQEAYRMYGELGDKKNEAMAGINIGLLYHEAGMVRDAISKYKKSLAIFKKLKHRSGIGTAYINLCSAYRDLHRLPEALSVARKALVTFQATGDKQGLADANASIGAILFLQGKKKEAEPYVKKALLSYRALGIRNGEADLCGQLARLYLAIGKRKEGKAYLKKAFEIYSEIKAKREAAEMSRQLSHAYEEDGNYRESLRFANQYIFYSKKSRQSVEKLKLQYEQERLENQKRLAFREKKILELKAKRNRLIQIFLILFLLVVLLVLWILYRSFRSKRNANNLLSTLNERLRIQSQTDSLTGLPNRRSMISELEIERSRYDRNQSDFAVLMVDIDNFKTINDTYGHKAGDEVLEAVAETFKNTVRQSDTVCRWGGEEFLFLLRDTDIDGAVILAEKIRQEVEKIELEMAEGKLFVTVTIGASSFSTSGFDIGKAISRADQAMYVGKKAGKNCVSRK